MIFLEIIVKSITASTEGNMQPTEQLGERPDAEEIKAPAGTERNLERNYQTKKDSSSSERLFKG
jgi:hypothetical protein